VSDARYYETLPHRMRLTVCRFARYRASGMQIICGLVSLQEINDQPNTGTRRPRTLARSVISSGKSGPQSRVFWQSVPRYLTNGFQTRMKSIWPVSRHAATDSMDCCRIDSFGEGQILVGISEIMAFGLPCATVSALKIVFPWTLTVSST